MFIRLEKINDNDDRFTFEMSKLKWQIEALQLLANLAREAVNKVESAAEFNSLVCLKSACLDYDELIKDLIVARASLEIIVTKARSAKP